MRPLPVQVSALRMHSPAVRARRVRPVDPAVRAAGVARTVDPEARADPEGQAVLVDLVVGTRDRVAPVVLARVVLAVPIGTRVAQAAPVVLAVPIGTRVVRVVLVVPIGTRVAQAVPAVLIGTRAVRAAPVGRVTGVQGLPMPSVGGTTPRGAMDRPLGVGARRRGSAGVVHSRLRVGFGTEAR
ncbi:hypothetical protein ABIA30_003722 [Mycobacterium sp. MAA66]